MNAPTWMDSKYQSCLQASTTPEDCRSTLSDLLYVAFSQHVEPYIMANEDVLRTLAASDTYAPTVMQHYTEVAANDRSRIAALALLALVRDTHPEPFPPGTFSNLRTKSDPELQLLLELHSSYTNPLPLPTVQAQDAVLELAIDPTEKGGIRNRATRALAAKAAAQPDPANVAYLQRLAESQIKTLDGSGSPLLSRALPFVLGVCARGCESLILELYSSGGVKRKLAISSLAFVRDRQLVDQIVTTEGKTAAGMDDEIEAAAKPLLFIGGVPDPRQAWQTK